MSQNKTIDLECPYCHSNLEPLVLPHIKQGVRYKSIDGLQCENIECWALWATNGVAKVGPKSWQEGKP